MAAARHVDLVGLEALCLLCESIFILHFFQSVRLCDHPKRYSMLSQLTKYYNKRLILLTSKKLVIPKNIFNVRMARSDFHEQMFRVRRL